MTGRPGKTSPLEGDGEITDSTVLLGRPAVGGCRRHRTNATLMFRGCGHHDSIMNRGGPRAFAASLPPWMVGGRTRRVGSMKKEAAVNDAKPKRDPLAKTWLVVELHGGRGR